MQMDTELSFEQAKSLLDDIFPICFSCYRIHLFVQQNCQINTVNIFHKSSN